MGIVQITGCACVVVFVSSGVSQILQFEELKDLKGDPKDLV